MRRQLSLERHFYHVGCTTTYLATRKKITHLIRGHEPVPSAEPLLAGHVRFGRLPFPVDLLVLLQLVRGGGHQLVDLGPAGCGMIWHENFLGYLRFV